MLDEARRRAAEALDRWLWRPWYKRTRRRYRASLREGRELSLLVVADAGIGNAVETTPLIQALRSRWPRVRLTLLFPFGDLFDDWCVVDEVVHSKEELRGRRFDRTYCGWAVSIPAGSIPAELGDVRFTWRRRPFFQPERELLLTLLPEAARGPVPPLYVGMRRPAAPPPRPLLAVVPGGRADGRHAAKRWPFFPELTRRLAERFGDLHLALVGGSGDSLEGELPERVLDLRGQPLREMAWVLRHARLTVGNDCGPMHIADAVGCETLVLFGPTCEVKNGPRGRGTIVSTGCPCRPCSFTAPERRARRDDCMAGLSVARVLAAVEERLEGG